MAGETQREGFKLFELLKSKDPDTTGARTVDSTLGEITFDKHWSLNEKRLSECGMSPNVRRGPVRLGTLAAKEKQLAGETATSTKGHSAFEESELMAQLAPKLTKQLVERIVKKKDEMKLPQLNAEHTHNLERASQNAKQSRPVKKKKISIFF